MSATWRVVLVAIVMLESERPRSADGCAFSYGKVGAGSAACGTRQSDAHVFGKPRASPPYPKQPAILDDLSLVDEFASGGRSVSSQSIRRHWGRLGGQGEHSR